jgi:hypothetical protein
LNRFGEGLLIEESVCQSLGTIAVGVNQAPRSGLCVTQSLSPTLLVCLVDREIECRGRTFAQQEIAPIHEIGVDLALPNPGLQTRPLVERRFFSSSNTKLGCVVRRRAR